MSDGNESLNVFFRLAVGAGAVFAITILALVATILSAPEAPVAQFLNKHGGTLIVSEVAVTMFLGLLAMAVDRRRILRDLRERESKTGTGSESEIASRAAIDEASP